MKVAFLAVFAVVLCLQGSAEATLLGGGLLGGGGILGGVLDTVTKNSLITVLQGSILASVQASLGDVCPKIAVTIDTPVVQADIISVKGQAVIDCNNNGRITCSIELTIRASLQDLTSVLSNPQNILSGGLLGGSLPIQISPLLTCSTPAGTLHIP